MGRADFHFIRVEFQGVTTYFDTGTFMFMFIFMFMLIIRLRVAEQRRASEAPVVRCFFVSALQVC